MTAESQPSEPQRYWDPWEPPSEYLEAGLRELARYVAPEALSDVKWGSDGAHAVDVANGAAGERAMIVRLYDRLAREPIDFWLDPWLPDAGGRNSRQRIRHPWLLVHGRQGTCLDFATTYAAMCLEASIAPLLALTLEEQGDRGHALVLLTPARSANPLKPIGSDGLASGFTQTDADGVVRLASWDDFETALAEDTMLPVDFARVVGEEGPPFAVAVERGREHLRQARLARDALWLVDVAWLQSNQRVVPFDPPVTRAPIRRYIPGGRAQFDRYESHSGIVADLERYNGTVVLHGDAGTGKSTIARELAFGAQFGAAWFLNASEPQALINSLSQADLSSRTDDLRVEEQIDREGFAEQARQRLLEADDDWVVVLDNADGDPARLSRWLPYPNPKRSEGVRQLVLVTTTNPTWRDVYDFPVLELEPVDDDEAAQHLPGSELIELAAGRPLLFDAFRRLAVRTGWDGARIAACASGEADGADLGAAKLWAAATEALEDERDALTAAACVAYLPPDGQPLEVLDALLADTGARGAVQRLSDLGLVDIDAEIGSLRMHRLVGAAARADLQRREPETCDEVVQRIACEHYAYALLDDHGDLATITQLEDWLGQLDGRTVEWSHRLGVAMHGIALLLELHGHTRRSDTRYRKADRHLEGDTQRLARGMHGRARTINQHHANDPIQLRQALEWAREAETMMAASDRVAAASSLAMQGLLLQKLADFPRQNETTIALLQEALGVLKDAHARLKAHFAESGDPELGRLDPELARRYFNLAGIRIRLARELPAEAKEHLDAAWDVYTAVGEARRAIYHRDVHPHIAACVIGCAYVDYFRALLLPATRVERTRWLRQATSATLAALEMREAQEGSLDLDEVTKCVRFLVKVAVARDF
ncbi:MAG TPA: ATP-binding protein [Solirubrobacteraceae bacterium]|nr:ATP-binding protein [Solirubrobacteraceae bacterium]